VSDTLEEKKGSCFSCFFSLAVTAVLRFGFHHPSSLLQRSFFFFFFWFQAGHQHSKHLVGMRGSDCIRRLGVVPLLFFFCFILFFVSSSSIQAITIDNNAGEIPAWNQPRAGEANYEKGMQLRNVIDRSCRVLLLSLVVHSRNQKREMTGT